jgi:uncharacterized protein YbcI
MFLLVVAVLLNSCRAQSGKEKIMQTSSDILSSIKSGNEQQFENLIGIDFKDIGKNHEMIQDDFKAIKKYYRRYVGQKIPEIVSTNEYNFSGSRKVQILFFLEMIPSTLLKV